MPAGEFRNYTAASRKSNLKEFGMVHPDKNIDYIAGVSASMNIIPLASGAFNGENNVFVFTSRVDMVTLRGLTLKEGEDYAISSDGRTITLTYPPSLGDNLMGWR